MERRGPLAGLLMMATLAAVLSGCGGSPTRSAATASTPVASPTPWPTSTPRPTPSPTAIEQPCGATLADGRLSWTQMGDLAISDTGLAGAVYPGRMLPETLPLIPYQVRAGALDTLPLTNPSGPSRETGYQILVCNTSTTRSHLVGNVAIKITNIVPYTGHLNEVRTCTTLYARQGMTGGGCGGAAVFDEMLQAAFAPDAAAGTSLVAAPVNARSDVGPLPVTLVPGQELSIAVQTTLPTTPASFTVQLGLALDGSGVNYPGKPSQPVLFAPVTHTWNGDACLAPAMQSQIPPQTDPPSYYICPVS